MQYQKKSELNDLQKEGAFPTPLLDTVTSPADLRKLSREELHQLCDELRYDLIHTVSQVGGHFASSLGVV